MIDRRLVILIVMQNFVPLLLPPCIPYNVESHFHVCIVTVLRSMCFYLSLPSDVFKYDAPQSMQKHRHAQTPTTKTLNMLDKNPMRQHIGGVSLNPEAITQVCTIEQKTQA